MKKRIAAGVIPIHPESETIIMIRRGMDQSHPNTWSFFGGKYDDIDGNPKETAKREFKEESGMGNFKYNISTKPIYINDDNHLRFYNYAVLVDERFVPDLEKEGEAQDYGWFSLDNLPHNMHPGAEEFFAEKEELVRSLIAFNK